MERGATFGMNRELLIIVILCADGILQKMQVRWQNRKIIELLATGLKNYNCILVGCVFESTQHFWLIWGSAVWFCSAAFEKYDLHTDCYSSKKIGKLHYFVEKQKVYFSCLQDTDLWSLVV